MLLKSEYVVAKYRTQVYYLKIKMTLFKTVTTEMRSGVQHISVVPLSMLWPLQWNLRNLFAEL